jgi:hypothetical protein
LGGYRRSATWDDPAVAWDDPGWDWLGQPLGGPPLVREVECQGIALCEQWASETVVLPEYAAASMPRGAADERGIGWMSSAYDPADDPREPWSGAYDTTRSVFPDGWPAGSGAKWISARKNPDDPEYEYTERKLFRSWVTIPGPDPVLCRVWWSSDEGATVWVAAEPIGRTSHVEEGREETQVADIVMWPGTYAVGIDTATHVTVGGDGVDPVCLAMAVLDTAGDPSTWVCVTDDANWVGCRRNDEPPGNEPPGPTPGAVIAYMVEEAQDRGVTGWRNVTRTFDADTDSYGQPWPEIVVERQVRLALDTYWAVWQALAETREVDVWITPDLHLHAAPRQGVARGLTLDAAQVARLGDERAADPGSWVAALAHDGWVDRVGVGPRREYGLELGTAISRPVAERIADASLAEQGRWDGAAKILDRPHVPLIDFDAGDTITLTYAEVNKPVRVLSLSATAGEGGLLWDAEFTDGDR